MMDFYQKGVTAFKAGQNEKAAVYLKKAVAIKDPKVKYYYYAEAYATLGMIYHYRVKTAGHLDQARQYYREALKIDPATAAAKKNLRLLSKNQLK